MATWITDRTQADIDRVKELTAKARSGTWTEEEQAEWAAGMKGALSYTDYNRIENGIKDLLKSLAHLILQGLYSKTFKLLLRKMKAATSPRGTLIPPSTSSLCR